MIIGSGPIVIGQACEFDYSGTQACKALRSLGYEIVLVNSNPATIMTDPGMADATYIEPLNAFHARNHRKGAAGLRCCPTWAASPGLNLSSELAQSGRPGRIRGQDHRCEVDAIERGEDRIAFKETMDRLGIEMPSKAVYSVEDAEKVADELGYPVVIRPAYTMGGTGGGLVYNVEDLRIVASRAGRQPGGPDPGGRIRAGMGRAGAGSGP
jgi:carbamoyl-phosphate synthase large subunit